MSRLGKFGTGSRQLLTALAVGVLLAGAGIATAQVNTAQIDLRVTDGTAALPGVTVRLTGTDTGFNRTLVTGAEGDVRIAAIPPGAYRLVLELEGFTPVTEGGLVLRVGQTARIEATMVPRKTEQVTVTAMAPLVDTVKTDSSTNIVPEQIESLPVPDRQFERLAFITPGVQRERGGYRFISGGPVIGAGGNASQSTIMVDGVDFTDQALGLARTRFSQDAIREFRVIANRFDTEIGGSAGGALSIVTRTGTNSVAGTVFGYYRADELRAKGALEQENLPYTRGQYGFTLGGPIVKDMTHYFASLEYIDENNITLFRPKGAFANRAADIKHPFKQTLAFFGLDHSFSPSQALNAKVVWEQYREKNFRVGGIGDESWGQQLNRDNWNVTLQHTVIPSESMLNELRAQIGRRKYDEPTNSHAMEEWFSSGNTLKTGTNTVGHLFGSGDQWEILDTVHFFRGKHDLKAGFSVQHIKEESQIENFQNGTMVYLTDDRSLPLMYLYGVGSSLVHKSTNLYGLFVQDDWRPLTNLTFNVGVRYDYDTQGNNPDFKHSLVGKRETDKNNVQPRVGFSWDVTGDGANLVRGGYGRFTGRYLLVPAFTELQQNGESGRIFYTRVNGMFYGLPPAFWLDPKNPTTTGLLLKGGITLLHDSLKAPQADQATLGWTTRLGHSNLFLDSEAIYVKGSDEIVIRDTNWSGNATHIRPNSKYTNINMYTNEGRSTYKALVVSLNGTIAGGHLLTASVTWAEKRNINDDFSPDYTTGYPSDPANIEAEYGRSRADERLRFVASGVFRLPWDLTVAPIYEYGTGQPWTKRMGYDYNGDGFNSDRPLGTRRNTMEGPVFRQLSLRLTKGFKLAGAGRFEVLAECFNVFNTVNYDVTSVDGAMYLAGPSLTTPTTAYKVNPNFGKYSATLKPREIQVGLRYSF